MKNSINSRQEKRKISKNRIEIRNVRIDVLKASKRNTSKTSKSNSFIFFSSRVKTITFGIRRFSFSFAVFSIPFYVFVAFEKQFFPFKIHTLTRRIRLPFHLIYFYLFCQIVAQVQCGWRRCDAIRRVRSHIRKVKIRAHFAIFLTIWNGRIYSFFFSLTKYKNK